MKATRRRVLIDASGLPSWRTQARRRLLAVLIAVALVISAVLGLLASPTAAIGSLLATAVAVGTYLLLRYLLRGVTDVPGDELDERQRQNRNEYFVWSYRILGFVVLPVLLLGIALLNRLDGSGELGADGLGALGPTAFLLVVALPVIVAGWLEPDEVA
ncbi:MAG: hypothetical protein AAF467_20200 [Actinomycetota bacterium]